MQADQLELLLKMAVDGGLTPPGLPPHQSLAYIGRSVILAAPLPRSIAPFLVHDPSCLQLINALQQEMRCCLAMHVTMLRCTCDRSPSSPKPAISRAPKCCMHSCRACNRIHGGACPTMHAVHMQVWVHSPMMRGHSGFGVPVAAAPWLACVHALQVA